MRLYYTPTSPFVRKVLVAAHELGLADRVETIVLRPSPLAVDATLSALNPLNKIPVLVLDDGTPLYDSRVICEYLDSLAQGRSLVPPAERWRVLRLQALADGIVDAGIQVFYERLHRPEDRQWAPWCDGQAAKVRQGLDALERESASFGAEVDLAQISAGVALGWLELRDVIGDLRAGRPTLFGWYEAFRARPSMRATEPRV